MSINKAVLPIAGLGTRFLPFTKVIPKEMLPINGVPILQLLIEEAFTAGIKEMVLVINEKKESIIRSYLSKNSSTSGPPTDSPPTGGPTELARLNNLLDSVKFHYIYQHEQLGDGHAILQAEELVGNEPFAVLFGDDLVTPGNALKELIAAHEKTSSSIIALQEIPIEESASYGIVKPAENSSVADTASTTSVADTASTTSVADTAKSPSAVEPPLYEIEGLVEKPSPENAPSNLGIIGKYICTPEIFENLRNADASVGGEIRLIDGFSKLIGKQAVYGLALSGTRYDTGTLDGYKKAINGLQQ